MQIFHIDVNNIPIPSWDEIFLRKVYLSASKSKILTTKVGAVLVRNKGDFASGFNGLPPDVDDNVPERKLKPERYFWEEHAERNCIFFCAEQGFSTKGATMYTQGIPCAPCARGIKRAGIIEVVVHKQWCVTDVGRERWEESVERSKIMFREAGVKIREVDIFLGIQAVKSGKIILV